MGKGLIQEKIITAGINNGGCSGKRRAVEKQNGKN